jgi:hypothetical protein
MNTDRSGQETKLVLRLQVASVVAEGHHRGPGMCRQQGRSVCCSLRTCRNFEQEVTSYRRESVPCSSVFISGRPLLRRPAVADSIEAETGAHGNHKRGGCRASISLPSQQLQEGAIAAVGGVAPGTPAQMRRDRLGLFRTQLCVKIFPKHHEDRFTFHSNHP